MWRVLQGIGSAFLFANAAALVTDAFPHDELGLAMGTNTMVAAIGLAIGPVLGACWSGSPGIGCSGSTCRSASPALRGAR